MAREQENLIKGVTRMIKRTVLLIFLGGYTFAAMAGNGITTKPCQHTPAEAIDRLEAALKTKSMTIFSRVDHAAGAAKAGLNLRPTVLLVFGNPKVGTKLMESNQTAGIDLPMKILAWTDNKGKHWLAYNDPAHLAKRHGIKDRKEVVNKMAGALSNFASQACAP
jgi:uncharacterized protein (DUF302 family)